MFLILPHATLKSHTESLLGFQFKFYDSRLRRDCKAKYLALQLAKQLGFAEEGKQAFSHPNYIILLSAEPICYNQ